MLPVLKVFEALGRKQPIIRVAAVALFDKGLPNCKLFIVHESSEKKLRELGATRVRFVAE